MIQEPLIFAAISDVAGKLRGKAFPAAELERRLARGVGWTPTNVQITCFDVIAESPYGSFGDLLMVPDPECEVRVDFEDGTPPEHFFLSHVLELDGAPWECCTRSILAQALTELERVAGVSLVAAFEHEFQLPDAERPDGDAYTIAGYSDQATFLSALMAALGEGGLGPECVMKEYGVDQYEVTVRPAPAMAAADASAVVRELTRATARRCGQHATFTPILNPASVGNGLHIHLSLVDGEGRPVSHDAAGTGGMSSIMASFVAGVLRDLEALVAFTAPSVISYARLTPHRWSAAFNNLGLQDREAAIRICPVTAMGGGDIAAQYNVEYRAADAAASPHLALAAIVYAGIRGIEDKLPGVTPVTEDLSLLGADELAARGFRKLPGTLTAALRALADNAGLAHAFPGQFVDIYQLHKAAEIAHVAELDEAALYAAYAGVY